MNIDKKLKELTTQICELDDRILALEKEGDGITIYDAMILLNSETLEQDLNSLMNHIRQLTKKVGALQIVLSDQ